MVNDETRILLITGAAGGIGSATVNFFAEKGWKVIGVDRKQKSQQFPEKRHLHRSGLSHGRSKSKRFIVRFQM